VSLLGDRERDAVAAALSTLERPVEIELELGPELVPVTVLAGGRELDFGTEAHALLEEIASLSDDVSLDVREASTPGRYPAITIGGALRYLGLPWGYELASLVGAVVEAGREAGALLPASRAALATIERDVELDVYVTPT
jgi:alkyl hydroperoxide reductase subunit AhpF